MTLTDCIELLTKHNKWRRGDDSHEMVDVTELGIAIDFAIEQLHRLKGLEK